MKKQIPRWAYVLLYLFKKAIRNEWAVNEQLAKDLNGGYALRNELAQSGAIETNGIGLDRRRADGKTFKLYRIKPDSIPAAEAILKTFELI